MAEASEVSKSFEEKLGTEKIGKLLMKFSVPAVISLLVNSLYNIVDQIFIGQGVGFLGNGATNVAFPLVTLGTAMAVLIGDGCASNFSLRLGAGDKKKASSGFENALIMMVVSSLLIFVLGTVFLNPMLRLFGATNAVMPYAIDYTSIILYGIPFVIIGTAVNSFIRADGSPAYAMISMLVGAVINTILDPIFIFVFEKGVKGAAIATIIGQIVSFFISICYIKRIKNIDFKFKNIKFDIKMCGTVLSLGISSFITQVAIMFVQIVMNNSLTHYGEATEFGRDIPLSAMGIVMKVNMILIAILVGIALGEQPIVGYNYGRGNFDRVKKAYKISVIVASAVAVLAWCMYTFFPKYIIAIFGSESQLYIDFAEKCFRIFLMCSCVTGFQIVSSNFFQAIGKPLKAMMLSLSRQILFLIPLMLILPAFWGMNGLLFSGPIADFSSFVLSAVFIIFEMRHLTKLSKEKEKTANQEG